MNTKKIIQLAVIIIIAIVTVGVVSTYQSYRETNYFKNKKPFIINKNEEKKNEPAVPGAENDFSVSKLWEVQEQYLRKSMTIKDTIFFEILCPDIDPSNSASCTSQVFIGSKAGGKYFRLLKGDDYLECKGDVQACQGFENNSISTVRAELITCGYKDGDYCLRIISGIK